MCLKARSGNLCIWREVRVAHVFELGETSGFVRGIGRMLACYLVHCKAIWLMMAL